MAKLKIKSGKTELVLHKSDKYVGIKPLNTRGSVRSLGVQKELLPNLGGFKLVTLPESFQSLDEQLDQVRQRRDVEVGTHVYHVEGSDKPLIPTGEIYIEFEEKTNEEEQKIVLEEFALELVERRGPDFVVAKVTKHSPNPIKVAHHLENIAMVRRAEPDLDALLEEYTITDNISDDLLSHSWHLQNNGRVADLNYPLKTGADAKVIDAWNRLGNLGKRNIVIAIIDNGFDLTHPDLNQKVFKPYDLWNQSSSIIQGDPNFTHGTPCASVALAAANGTGIVGAAPMAKFMPISGTSFSIRATEVMFKKAVENGADIISCSWGTTDAHFAPGVLKEAVISKAAKEGRNGKGCIILFAAGNDDFDYINYYATNPDVIAVGASTSQDEHANYSNRGRELDIVAPSNGDWPIIAARANWDPGTTLRGGGAFKYWADGRSRGDQYKHFGGTSSATPLVAGICALMLSANPDLTAKEVREILTSTADKIGRSSEYDSNGHSKKYGYGRVNADKAVAEALRRKDAIVAPPPVVETQVSSGQGLFKFSVERQPSRGFAVQIGVFKQYGNVLVVAEKLQRKFNQSIIVNINELNGKTVYRIMVGPFLLRSSASEIRRRIVADGEYSGAFLTTLEQFA